MKFVKLLEPGFIGNLEIKNRVIKAPCQTRFASRDGSVTSRLLRYYKEVAKGGVGLVIVEHTYIDREAGPRSVCQLGIYDDACISGLAALADIIKQSNVRAGIQITHAGRQGVGPHIVGASRVPWEESLEETGIIPAELSTEEILNIIKAFGKAALRAKEAGFDMIEIHGAHGYLITNFLSGHTNRRTDWYGGSLENRMRFPLEVVKAIREKVGREFPVGMRISAVEYEPDGIILEESKEFARRLEQVGIDIIHVSASNHHITDREIEPMYYPPGSKMHLAEAIKKVVSIPVIASGSITTPELGEEILRTGKADFISLGRPSLADPYFVKKIEEDRCEDIVPCIRCMACLERGGTKGGVTCTVNVSLGRDEEFLEIKRTSIAKKVMVIGGGVGGMEAARVAALRGHRVHLYEKQGVLGGLMKDISIPEFKKDIRRLLEYYVTQLGKLDMNIIYQEATIDTIVKEKPDVVILATGSSPVIPKIPAVDKPFVLSVLDVFRGKEVKGNAVVVGGGSAGCEAALYLADQGRKVKLIEMAEGFALDTDRGSRRAIMEKLKSQHVEMHSSFRFSQVIDKGILAVDQQGREKSFGGETVVLALGMQVNDGLVEALKEKGIKFFQIGDCVKPRKLYDAIYEGDMVARNI
jgi:2,4-dienoyl-CoA reductase-like NADH-dependent reductase (Old Yellow Enzyme family)/thioredoxin reductase